MRGMTEGLTPYTAAPAPQRLGYKPRPPVGTKLGAGTETWRGDLWGNPRVADSPAQRTTQEATGARVNLNPETLGPVKSRTAAPPEQPPPGPPGRTPTHQAGKLATPPQKRAETAPRGRGAVGLGRVWGATCMGVGGVAWPTLSPVGGLGPAAARKTDCRRLF